MKHFLIAFLTIISFSLAADAAEIALRINQTDGKTVVFAFATNPEISFDGSGLVVEVPGESPASFAFDDVESFDFTDYSPTSAAAPATGISWNGATLTINGLGEDTTVMLYDISGRLIVKKNASGSFSLERSSLNHGIYILRAGDFTVKFTL